MPPQNLGSKQNNTAECPYTAACLQYNTTRTVEPPNKGHFGNGSFVLCSEVVPISEVQSYNPQIMDKMQHNIY